MNRIIEQMNRFDRLTIKNLNKTGRTPTMQIELL